MPEAILRKSVSGFPVLKTKCPKLAFFNQVSHFILILIHLQLSNDTTISPCVNSTSILIIFSFERTFCPSLDKRWLCGWNIANAKLDVNSSSDSSCWLRDSLSGVVVGVSVWGAEGQCFNPRLCITKHMILVLYSYRIVIIWKKYLWCKGRC